MNIDEILRATSWREIGLPKNKANYRKLMKQFHPDVNDDSRANEAVLAINKLWDSSDYYTRLAKGTSLENHAIRWEVDEENVDLAERADAATSSIKAEIWVVKTKVENSHTRIHHYGIKDYEEGWWFIKDFPSFDTRTAIWIYKRLLAAIEDIAAYGFIHPDICEDKVIINPKEHGLMLDGWWGAVKIGEQLIVRPDSKTPFRYFNGTPADTKMSVAQASNLILKTSTIKEPELYSFIKKQSMSPMLPHDTFWGFSNLADKHYQRQWHELKPPQISAI